MVVEPKTQDLPAILRRETDGLGPECTFDCVGNATLLEQAIGLVRRLFPGIVLSAPSRPKTHRMHANPFVPGGGVAG